MIDLDVTLFIQLANFLITLVVLHYLLITPVREQISKRRATMESIENDVKNFVDKADSQLADYENTLKEAREKAALLRTEAREAAEAAGLAILSEAAREAQSTVHAAQNAMRAEVERARETLISDMDAFTKAAADKLLA